MALLWLCRDTMQTRGKLYIPSTSRSSETIHKNKTTTIFCPQRSQIKFFSFKSISFKSISVNRLTFYFLENENQELQINTFTFTFTKKTLFQTGNNFVVSIENFLSICILKKKFLISGRIYNISNENFIVALNCIST